MQVWQGDANQQKAERLNEVFFNSTHAIHEYHQLMPQAKTTIKNHQLIQPNREHK